MENYKLVLPEHLNHYGYLFGGNLLKWSDEFAWIAASLDYPGNKFVTIAMDGAEFRKGIRNGAILRFKVQKVKEGKTSVQYEATVHVEDIETGQQEAVFATRVTFVCIDEKGHKRPLRSELLIGRSDATGS